MTSVYSFGAQSPLKFYISDKLANDYNDYVSEFFSAQRRFMQKFGRPWNPEKDPIRIRLSKAQMKSVKRFYHILENHPENDGRYYPNELLDDYLVRNMTNSAIASTARRAVTKFDRAIGVAVALGALSVALRGLQRHL